MASSSSSYSTSRCPSCNEMASAHFTCPSCKAFQYCGEGCQAADKRFHDPFCSAYRALAPRPQGRGYHLVVAFNEDYSQPVFQWMHGGFEHKLFFRLDAQVVGRKTQTNATTGVKLGRDVVLYFDQHFIQRYAANNEVVDTVCAGENHYKWRGPLLAIVGPPRTEGFKWGPEKHGFCDMDLLACSDLAAFLVDYQNHTPQQVRRRVMKGAKVDAVKAHCQGAQAECLAPYLAIKLPPTHPALWDGKAEVAAISQAIGFPLLTWKCPEIPSDDTQPSITSQVTHMHKNITPSSPTFGHAPPQWSQVLSTTIIFHQTHHPLIPTTATTFGAFCSFHIDPFLQNLSQQLTDESPTPTRIQELQRQVAGEVKAENWAMYREDWEKAQRGEEVEKRMYGQVRMGLTKEDGDRLFRYLSYGSHRIDG